MPVGFFGFSAEIFSEKLKFLQDEKPDFQFFPAFLRLKQTVPEHNSPAITLPLNVMSISGNR